MKMMSSMNLRLSGNLEEDTTEFFTTLEYSDIAEHSKQVARTAVELAIRFGVDAEQARMAGFLHDVGRMIPDDQKVEVCRQANISVLPEEIEYVGILHQKLAPVIAREMFGCNDEDVMRAIECHTTLKAEATDLEKVCYLADKLSWPASESSFHDAVEHALNTSLNAAVLCYVGWCLASKPKVVHPWLREAFESLKG
ncbi:MAG: putative metal-dependent phosphohydrolase [Bacillota bacterium]|nr:MAG: putative metal-dependent phosphohydrolase [Bacillota bacterium]